MPLFWAFGPKIINGGSWLIYCMHIKPTEANTFHQLYGNKG